MTLPLVIPSKRSESRNLLPLTEQNVKDPSTPLRFAQDDMIIGFFLVCYAFSLLKTQSTNYEENPKHIILREAERSRRISFN